MSKLCLKLMLKHFFIQTDVSVYTVSVGSETSNSLDKTPSFGWNS